MLIAVIVLTFHLSFLDPLHFRQNWLGPRPVPMPMSHSIFQLAISGFQLGRKAADTPWNARVGKFPRGQEKVSGVAQDDRGIEHINPCPGSLT